MPFQPPYNQPSLSPRPAESNYWRPSRSPVLDIPQSTGGFFGGERTLPMYKDKPYFAPRRTGPKLRRRKIIIGSLCLFVLTVLWYYTSAAGTALKSPESKKGEELWEWVQSLDETTEPQYNGKDIKGIDWEARREKVRDAFIVTWDGYEKYGWGLDEYRPTVKAGRNMVEGGMGWMIVDALDTMMIMNLTSRVQHARSWIHNSLRYDQDHDVNTFETTIRMMGGLLSAHYLSTEHPELAPVVDNSRGAPGEDLYIEKATDLADRLMGAFDSPSGIPYASIVLNKSEGLPSHADGGASSTAEATTVQMEFKYLAKLTGEAEYWRAVEHVMEVVDAQKPEDGLVPIFIHAETGKFRGDNIRLGSRGDSYYEYLVKQYLQTSQQEPVYKEMWDEALTGIRKHLITYSKNARLTILGERPSGLRGTLSPKMDHLVCFLPGTIALGLTGGAPVSKARMSPQWSQKHEEELLLAKELTKTCWTMYLGTQTGLAPEITYFRIDDPPIMETDMYPDSTIVTGNTNTRPKELPYKSQSLYPLDDESLSWRRDIDIHPQDRHNLQRPETLESLMFMYRITGDEIYRHWGWEIFKSFIRHTAIVEHDDSPDNGKTDTDDIKKQKPRKPSRITGFTSLQNADSIPPQKRDNMESFWMAETLKYFYLLFSDKDFLPLEEVVFNTEAHPFPRFKPSGELKTGWQRQSRKASENESEGSK